ncbi:hypothetical protein ACHWQZ_G011021 [Mnemiopsis leidyi]
MRLLVCVVLLASPVFTSICNLDKCFNISSSELKSGVELEEIAKDDFSLTSIRVVVLTGQVQDNCSISLMCTSDFVNWKTELSMEFINLNPNIQLEFINPNEKKILLVNATIPWQNASVSHKNTAIDIGLQFKLSDTVFAYYYSQDLKKSECSYIEVVNSRYDYKSILKGEHGSEEIINRYLSTADCGEELMISLCPCSEPVITELVWKEDENTLHCTAASIEGRDNIFISWTENDTSVHNNITEKSTEESRELTKTSILHNVTSLEMARDITCTVSMQANKNRASTRTITIPAHSKEPDGEASEGQDENDSNSQAFLTILIIILVVSVVAVAVFCFGAVKLVQRYKDKRAQEPQRLDAVEPTAGNSVDDGQIIQPYAENGGSGTQIESNYHDLEELLDAVEPRVVRTDEVPLYTQVNIKKPVEQENIYNRLDPKLMTVNRGDPDRWRTLRSGEAGASPHTLGASPHTLGASPQTRMVEQPPVVPALPGTLARANNFCPASEEGHYEMQTLKL